MTLTDDYAATTRRTESVLTGAMDSWKNGLNAMTTPLQALPTTPAFPQVDLVDAVERQFAFIKQVVDVNYEYARQLAEAADTVSGAFRQHVQGLNAATIERVQRKSEAIQNTVEKVEQSVRDTADQVEQAQRQAREQAEQVEREARQQAEKAEREERQQAEKAERDQRRQARNAAREHYQSLNKHDLAEEAAKRNLPKAGTVDELVGRLVELALRSRAPA